MSEIPSKISPPTKGDSDAIKEERRAKLAKKAGRFRVLIVGRANAGKTTILKKICNTDDEPEIYNSEGQKIDTSKIEPTQLRGIHDIENEMVFRSNPGFIFHDSRGFEAGGADELEKVKAFISKRSKEKKLADQVHIIWYCIPMTDDSRPITNAEIQFFSKCGTGKVPVIVVFTKCEALKLKAFEILQTNLSKVEARKGAAEYAKQHLWNAHLDLEKYEYKPKAHVYLQELDKPGVNCDQLVECSADALDGDRLQAIFVSTQQNLLEMQIKYSTRKIIQNLSDMKIDTWGPAQKQEIFLLKVLREVMDYFPYWMVSKAIDYKLVMTDQRIMTGG